MNFKTKKGQGQMWWIIIAAVVAVVASVLVIMWFKGAGDKGFDGLGDTIDSIDDSDGDGVADLFDKCTSADGDEVKSNGCVEGQSHDT